jgi:YbbR domain-containing protein
MDKQNRTPVIIASAVFAVVLWVTVNMGFEYTSTVYVPVQVQNIPTDVALSKPLPETMRLRLRGEGWKLFGMYVAGETRYTIDLRNNRDDVQLRTLHELDERLRLPGGIEVLEVSPPLVNISLESRTSTKIPIVVDLDVGFREGFNIIGPVTTVPESITVGGAQSVIAGFDHWKTKPLHLRDIRNPVKMNIELSDTLSGLVYLDQRYAMVSFDVQPTAEKSLNGIRLDVVGVPSNREVVLIPPRIDIVIRGGINQLATITPENFTATVQYRTILTDTSGSIVPVIEGPEEVRIVIRDPERFQYIIRRLE